MNSLIKELKENKEDFEFYPTTKEMIKVIYEELDNESISVLDIGCGTCHLDKYFKEFYEENKKIREDLKEKEKQEKENIENEFEKKVEDLKNKKGEFPKWDDEDYKKIVDWEDKEKNKIRDKYNYSKFKTNYINKYYVMEKSKILLDRLDKDKIIVGTDFNLNNLADKPIDVIFSNPPYSEYEKWTFKILDEGNFNRAYLVIPKRWEENKNIQDLIKRREIEYEILKEDNFLEADRKARAKVHIIKFKRKTGHYRDELLDLNEEYFEEWFNENFNISSEDENFKKYEKENISNNLKLLEKDKIKRLVNLYEEERDLLFNNFKAICSLDVNTLDSIGIDIIKIKNSIKEKIKLLKNKYWEIAFNELEEITNHLTSNSVNDLLQKFSYIKNVDFDLQNIYGLIIWVIKNSNDYAKTQLIDFYYELSSFENVKPYKSNQKLFEGDKWRCFSEKIAKRFNLDYRLICDNYLLGIDTSTSSKYSKDGYFRKIGVETELSYGLDFEKKINDLRVILKNLNFQLSKNFNFYDITAGKKHYLYSVDGEILLEFKPFKNRNLHIKLNIEVAKALNVEVARLLGWIKSKEDIKKEFREDLAKGAEKYFKTNIDLSPNSNSMLLDFNEVEK